MAVKIRWWDGWGRERNLGSGRQKVTDVQAAPRPVITSTEVTELR